MIRRRTFCCLFFNTLGFAITIIIIIIIGHTGRFSLLFGFFIVHSWTSTRTYENEMKDYINVKKRKKIELLVWKMSRDGSNEHLSSNILLNVRKTTVLINILQMVYSIFFWV